MELPIIRQRAGRASAALSSLSPLLAGLSLTSGIAITALILREIPGVSNFSPMILAILLGMIFHNTIGTPLAARPGVIFSLRRILRFAIVLLGLQLTTAQLAEVGWTGTAIIAATLAATFAFTKWIGRLIGVDEKLAELIAAGTSICGASAVIATNTVTGGREEDVAYAVACVTVFGSLAMFLYPLLPALLHLEPRAYGLWAGASIHEIAQVVAATFQDGQVAGEFGTIAKLSRVMMLAPLVVGLGIIAAKGRTDGANDREGKPGPSMPWFVLGFIALILINSIFPIGASLKSCAMQLTSFMLAMALAAMGLETDIRKLKAKGFRPLLLSAAAWLFIGAFALLLVKVSGI